MIPLKNLEWCGVSVKVKILEGENTDRKKKIQKQEKFLLISEIKHFKGPRPQWHKRQK